MAKAKCKNCGAVIESPEGSGLFVSCDCFEDESDHGFFLDEGPSGDRFCS